MLLQQEARKFEAQRAVHWLPAVGDAVQFLFDQFRSSQHDSLQQEVRKCAAQEAERWLP